DGCSEERVLAGVVQHDGALAPHEDLRGVLVHGPLAVSNVWHVLQKNGEASVYNSKFLHQQSSVRGRPCHPPHCSWRSPWNGMSAVRIGSSRRYSQDGCS
ncbi:hypothetical protein CFC21_058645, partial [Triticum aestivum]